MKKTIRSIELLESRIAPATFTVTSNADDGTGSLREALALAFSSMGTDTIAFNLAAGQTTIQLVTGLDVISPVILDGRTQPGYVASPLVTLLGTFAFSQTGLAFGPMASGSQVHGLAISDFDSSGIHLNASNVIIAGCTITGNQTGINVVGNDVTIGTMGAVGRNVISGNTTSGILGEGMTGLVVQNSHIGVDRTGTIAQGNGVNGILLVGAGNLTVGGAEKNVIAGNGNNGIDLEGVYGEVRVLNNWVGIFADGSFGATSRNGGIGIHAYGSANFFIGTDGMLGAPNTIANNSGPAIIADTVDNFGAGTAVITGNIIGSAPIMMGLVPAPNGIDAIRTFGPGIRIGGAGAEVNNIAWQMGAGINSLDGKAEVRGNVFAGSAGEVIDVFGDGPTPNDADDFDGAQNFPVLDGALLQPVGFSNLSLGTLDSTPNTSFEIRFYGYNQPAYTHIASLTVTTDAAGLASATQALPTLTGYTNIAATATNITTGRTSEMSPLAPVAPGLFFSGDPVLTQAEGNAGATLVSFNVAMLLAPAGAVSVQLSAAASSTATNGADYTFTPSLLIFSPTTTTQMVTVAITGDTNVEPTELINFVLSNIMGNAILIGSTKSVSIVNDDTSLKISTDGKVATWRDVDGDFVTLKSTKGILDAGDFTMNAEGAFGGEVLQLLDLSNDGAPAKGAGLTLTAKFDKANNRGDGAIHAGFLNATGVDLGIVKMDGDLGRIAAGDAVLTDGSIKSLTVGSIGVLGTSTQAAGGSLASTFQGKVGALMVRGDVIAAQLDATSGAAGSFGAITITGNFESRLTGNARITATSDIASVKILGSMIAQSGVSSYMDAGGKIGPVTVIGSLLGAGLSAGTTIGKVIVGGDVEGASIFAVGKAQPANAAAALAIAGLTVRGRVADSTFVAGFGNLNNQTAQNPDAQIGAVLVGGDWVRSSMLAGVSNSPDQIIGNADDAIHAPTAGFTNNPAILSKIASVTIKGHIYGTSAAGDGFGFVAQSIGKFVRGITAYTLRPNPAQPLDLVSLSIHGDVFLREVL